MRSLKIFSIGATSSNVIIRESGFQYAAAFRFNP
jgi:hypothetical protein